MTAAGMRPLMVLRRRFSKASVQFVCDICPARDVLRSQVARRGADLNARHQLLEASGLDSCLMNLVDRPPRGLENAVVEGMPVMNILQNALSLAWEIYPDYSMGLHMMVDYFAEKLTVQDARALSANTKATLKSIATATTRHPMWRSVVAPAAAAALDRANRGVSFAQASTGSLGHMAWLKEAMHAQLATLDDYMRHNPDASEDEVRAATQRTMSAAMRSSVEATAAIIAHGEQERARMATAAGVDKRRTARAVCGNPRCSQVEHTQDGGPSFPRCSRCRTVVYCGQACQREHWPQHKRTCRAWNTASSPAA